MRYISLVLPTCNIKSDGPFAELFKQHFVECFTTIRLVFGLHQ